MGDVRALTTVPVADIFTAWQGEGPHAGRLMSFLRLGLCNLSCEWCDTPYTWDRTRFDLDVECPQMTAEEILAGLYHTDHVVLTGGEPLIHAANPALVEVVRVYHQRLDVETNGTLPPPPWWPSVRLFVVSPKINTRDPERRRIRPSVLRRWSHLGPVVFKFVCTDAADVEAAAVVASDSEMRPHKVWIMPEGTDPDGLLAHARAVSPVVARHGFNLTLRQQILLYGDQRGT